MPLAPVVHASQCSQCSVVIARDQLFDMGCLFAEVTNQHGQVQESCMNLAVFAEANGHGLVLEGLVDGQEDPFGAGYLINAMGCSSSTT
jgi:hypothetical protein